MDVVPNKIEDADIKNNRGLLLLRRNNNVLDEDDMDDEADDETTNGYIDTDDVSTKSPEVEATVTTDVPESTNNNHGPEQETANGVVKLSSETHYMTSSYTGDAGTEANDDVIGAGTEAGDYAIGAGTEANDIGAGTEASDIGAGGIWSQPDGSTEWPSNGDQVIANAEEDFEPF